MNHRRTTIDILKMKGKEKISCLTAYDYVTAGLLDQANCDLILIGDSLGNVVLGHETTLQVTMNDIVRHSQAVARGSQKALLVADMPFLSYQTNPSTALENAGRLLQEGGVQAVKLEGGKKVQRLVKKMVQMGVPVLGHIGMTPQSVYTFGGYKRTGATADEAQLLLDDALALQKAGAFAVVLECVQHEVTKKITANLQIPTIGIGSGDDCDGQILVINDLLGYGLTPPPPFAKPAIQMANIVRETVSTYVQRVKGGK